MIKTFSQKLCLILLLGVLLYLPLMNGFNAWIDEQFSLYLSGMSWKDMFQTIVKEDCHPPLHYVLLRLWNLGRDFHDVGWVRLLSVFILVLTGLLAFPVRRLYGEKVALFFAAFMFLFPQSFFFGTDMRMYGLLNLEITAMVVYTLLILRDGKTGDWIKFVLFSLMALYTHYFGALTLAILDTFLFFAILVKKNNLKRQMFFLFGSAGILAIAFLPWFLLVFWGQANYIYDGWYPGMDTLLAAYYAFLQPVFLLHIGAIPVVVFMTMALFWWLLVQAALDKDRKNRLGIVLPVLLYFSVLGCGTVISLTVRQMMNGRYLTPYLGSLVLALALIISEEKKFKKLFFISLIAMALCVYVLRFTVLHTSFYRDLQEEIRRSDPEKTIILCPFGNTMSTMNFYLPEYTTYLVPIRKSVLVPSEVMRPAPAELDLKDKQLYLLYQHDGGSCEKTLYNSYDHGQYWCLQSLTTDEAEAILERSRKFIEESKSEMK